METKSSQSGFKRRKHSAEKSAKKSKTTASEFSSSTRTNFLNGLTLCVSTLDPSSSSSNDIDKTGNSYKEVSNLIQSLGGIVSAQVHNRVFGVICNASSVAQNTQRVRKALKKGISLIDVEWLYMCKSERKRADHVPYLLNYSCEKGIESTVHIKTDKKCNSNVDFEDLDEYAKLLTDSSIKWSEPISLACCCVCHDDDRDDCKWCFEEGSECNIILQKKKKC